MSYLGESKKSRKSLITKIFSYIVFAFSLFIVGTISNDDKVGACSVTMNVTSSGVSLPNVGDCFLSSLDTKMRVGSQSFNIIQSHKIDQITNIFIGRTSRTVSVSYKWACGFLWLDTCTETVDVGTVSAGTDSRSVWIYDVGYGTIGYHYFVQPTASISVDNTSYKKTHTVSVSFSGYGVTSYYYQWVTYDSSNNPNYYTYSDCTYKSVNGSTYYTYDNTSSSTSWSAGSGKTGRYAMYVCVKDSLGWTSPATTGVLL